MPKILMDVIAPLLVAGIIALLSWLFLRTRWSKSYRQATFHLRRGEALQEEKRFEEAREEIEKSIRILEDEPRYKLLSEAHLRLGDIDLNLKSWESAIRNYVLCRESAARVKEGISPDALYLRLGKAYRNAGRLDDAFQCIDDARRIQERVEDHPLLAETYARLGEIESSRGHVEVGIEHYLRSLRYQERIRDRRTQAATRISIADLYVKKRNPGEALNHYREAVSLYREVGDLAIARRLESEMAEINL
jgi:tetratricopeptide (TPR) repeat protein